jgi:hypothetical protein
MINKKKHLALFILYPIVAAFVSFIIKPNAFGSVILFLIIPSTYLSVILRGNIKKTAIFALVTSAPFIIFADYIAHLTNQWVVPDTIFAARLLGLVPVEDALWAFFLTYFMIMFYELFLDDRKDDKKVFPSKTKYLAVFFSSILIIFLFLYFFLPSYLYISYFYLWFGMALIFIPIIIELIRKPNLITKVFLTGVYFFFVSFLYEITALKLGWWCFPGQQFVGWVSIFGVRFPFEEFFFYVLLLAMACVSYYEFFDGDEK